MSFFIGRVTALRFRVSGDRPAQFGDDDLEKLREHAAGKQTVATADGVQVGWAAGASVLDTDFELEKNIVADALVFDLRVDTDRLPTDLLKAYYEVELKALAKGNPSGIPSARQKREAKETARERLEHEAKDGRFAKRKCVPVLWDRTTNEVLFGATALTHVDRLCGLFEQTFGRELECLTAGPRADAVPWALSSVLVGLAPTAFIPNVSPPDVAWIANEKCQDWLGNEFLLWLWFTADSVTDTLKLDDGSDATFMFSRTLAVDCPRGQSGNDAFASEGPTQLPEARRAVQAGKLPRRAGLTLVRHASQYELTLHAETLAVASAKLPPHDEAATTPRARLEHRVEATRGLLEALDLLYAAFLRKRLSAEWAKELAAVTKWLTGTERRAAA
ncbi:hypothetical protein [Gemmata sp.]|uniref:hypothetical protein n=1 Tax=Gemmata sp. TaxID=1914242 RepID=UPI003F72F753